jgi:hypothetical protein
MEQIVIVNIRKDTTSAMLARVEEISPVRVFTAQNDDDDTPATVEYRSGSDSLFCLGCNEFDNCTHTARIRLCGILSNAISKRLSA